MKLRLQHREENIKGFLQGRTNYNQVENGVLFSKWHRHTRKKEIRVLLSGVEPKTFQLLVWMLYHWATIRF